MDRWGLAVENGLLTMKFHIQMILSRLQDVPRGPCYCVEYIWLLERLDLVSDNPVQWNVGRETSNEGLDVRSSSGRGGQTKTGALNAGPELELASWRGCVDEEYKGDTANSNLKKDVGDTGG